ncbi:DNA excision repair protein ERCC-6-like [Fukomys damarensis]|uniref:DNA excision repair protein ERCC-6-like n=1 Tax=Fukomys damarensis TaxID=885580 RepID=UPI00053FB6DC|nr:DNA excision repair protein ERCC-6-like [Fukomys damarensis]
MENYQGLAEAERLSGEQTARYMRYVKEAKEATKNGDLEEALKLFNLAKDIFPNKKLMSRIQKLQKALEELEEHEDDEFADVCNSGLLLYRELYDQLFEHQKEGVAFLYSLYRDGRKGGILADDMGLGKTVQIIAFLSGMFDASLVNHVLLIMPANLISMWVKEFAKWTPGMRAKTFHGPSKDKRTRSLHRVQQRTGVLITTYQTLINNWQQLSSCNGQAFVWDYVILDEAHKIKSSSTKSAICARAIPASHRLLLTGTPIQNNLQELWSLFDFACQGSLLGTLKTFKVEYEIPIIRAREKDATPGEKALGFKISENLMEILKPYFLRRTKEEVQKKRLNIPEVRPAEKNSGVDAIYEMPSFSRKNDLIIWIRLVPLQEEIYRKFVSLDRIKKLLMETRSPLAELGVLKKLCDHPRLLSAQAYHLLHLGTVRISPHDGNEEDLSDVDSIAHVPDDALMGESGKMIFLIDLLKRLRDEGHQTLVFSQSRQILNIVERLLKNKHFKILRIDGTVTHLLEREKRINLFQQNKDYSVFLLTTQVGGAGLTLTAATRVVIFDPSWNPATDAQAVDRIYRIGQKENVVVYRLITCGTVEEKIYRRQVFKDSLIRQTTGDKKNPFRYFSKQDLRELFIVEDLQNSTTQLQLQSLHAAQRRSDKNLDEHITYLQSLGIAGISDHDLIYTHDQSIKEELDVIEESQYIQQRIQKAQSLVEFESQNTREKQRTGHEEAWPIAPLFPSQTKKKCPELKKSQPWPSPCITIHPTQEGDITFQMANVNIDDRELSKIKMNMTMLQGGMHPCENTLNTNFVAPLLKELGSVEEIGTASLLGNSKSFVVGNEALQKKALQEEPKQEALQENALESFNCLAIQAVAPTLDLRDDDILYHCNPWPRNPITSENQSTRSSVSVIEISDELSTSHDALQHVQASAAESEGEPLASSLQYACDFSLSLEDSSDNIQNLSTQSLGHVEKENSVCVSAANSSAESVHSKVCLPLDFPKEDSEPEEVVVNVKTRSKARRITSGDEDEDDSLKGTSSTNPFSISLFHFSSVKQFVASTPKDNSAPGLFCSPKMPGSVNTSMNSRRSLASRSSLIKVALDHMEERLDNSSRAQHTEDHLEDGAKESSDETSEDTKDPSEERLSLENKSGRLTMAKPLGCNLQAPLGASVPLSAEPLVDSSQGKAEEAANDYETLVTHGKELKECGKIQEALNCLVKALDIKSSDPEVMLMTLSLYKQLRNT